MKKLEKIDIINKLLERIEVINFNISNPQASVVNDSLSFIRNIIDKKNATVWEEQINRLHWYRLGFRSRNELNNDDVIKWQETKERFINILKSIKQEIELYTLDENYTDDENHVKIVDNNNKPIIFISHCFSDKLYGDALQKFIIGLGVKNDQLIYTSHPLHKIPLDMNIYEYLRNNINKNVFMIVLWSNEYLESPACLNEMGAAWIMQSDYTNIYTPTFEFGNPKYHKCAVDTRKMGAVLKGDSHCKTNMLELKDKILSLYNLKIDEKTTTFLLDEFNKDLEEINK